MLRRMARLVMSVDGRVMSSTIPEQPADGMDITFLGTSSQPTASRYTSSLSLRLASGEHILFDAGEGTQRRMMDGRCSVKPSKIAAVCITHLHGDHVFGLPGLVCSILNARSSPLHVYGPLGIRSFLRTSLSSTYSFSRGLYVHELRPAPPPILDPSESSVLAADVPESAAHTLADLHLANATVVRGFEPGDKNLYYPPPADVTPQYAASPHWVLPFAPGNGSKLSLKAAVITHVPHVLTVGYVLTEPPVPGSLRVDRLKANPAVGRLGAWCKDLVAGNPVTLPNGTILEPNDYVSPPRPGRKIVILGDTSDPSGIEPLGRDADVLIHEASLRTADRGKALDRGHSTTCMAGEVAARINAKTLVLNHLSPKYIGPGNSATDIAAATELGQEAEATFMPAGAGAGADDERRVIVARDFLTVSVLPSTRSRPRPSIVVRDPPPLTSPSSNEAITP